MAEIDFSKVGFNVRGFVLLAEGATMPKRATKNSAGYDVCALHDYRLFPNEQVKIETGVAAYMQPDENLNIVPRSGLAARNVVSVTNSPAIIDADFYPTPFCVLLINHGTEPLHIKKGDRIAQAIFRKFLLADGDNAEGERVGGFGHTGI